MKVQEIEFELEGIAPLKMDKWLDGEKQPKNEKGYLEQAKKKTYTDNKGNICVPANSIKASMRLSSSEVGKKMEAKKNRQTIKSAIFIEPDNLTILNSNKPMKEPDEIVKDIIARGQGDKVTRVPTYRPLIKKWKVNGKILSYGVPLEFIRECLELAGIRFGLLGHRPEFGRFMVTKFLEIKK